jgi:hypothetical protein
MMQHKNDPRFLAVPSSDTTKFEDHYILRSNPNVYVAVHPRYEYYIAKAAATNGLITLYSGSNFNEAADACINWAYSLAAKIV